MKVSGATGAISLFPPCNFGHLAAASSSLHPPRPRLPPSIFLNPISGRNKLFLRAENLRVEQMDLKKEFPELNKNLYPSIEPYSTGFLKVSDLHTMYWEQSGNPNGHPVVFLHGGPGGGTSPNNRRFFDPVFYRIILFDQRGAGKSKPHACLEENTTWDLVGDIEKLREHLKIPEWQVLGGSWGSTLALTYSMSHPDKVTGIILRGIFLLRKKEIDWFYEGGAAAIYPDVGNADAAPVVKHLIQFNPSSQLPIKLSGSHNFTICKAQIAMPLHGHDLYGHLDGTKLSPPQKVTTNSVETANPDYKDWFRQDKLIQNALMASVDARIAPTVASADTFKAAWDQLHTSFANKSQTCIFSLCHHLSQVSKDNKSIAEYIREIRSLSDELATAGSPVNNEELVVKILSGLGPEFREISAAIRA